MEGLFAAPAAERVDAERGRRPRSAHLPIQFAPAGGFELCLDVLRRAANQVVGKVDDVVASSLPWDVAQCHRERAAATGCERFRLSDECGISHGA